MAMNEDAKYKDKEAQTDEIENLNREDLNNEDLGPEELEDVSGGTFQDGCGPFTCGIY
jgi:hypothetical protein